MRDLLKMSGAATGKINHLEAKARFYQLSEGQIRHVYPLALLKAVFPASVATKMKTCVGEWARTVPCCANNGANLTPALTLAQANTHTRTHAHHGHTRTHAHTHTHTNTHTHTHTKTELYWYMQMQRNMTGQVSKQHKDRTKHTRHYHEMN